MKTAKQLASVLCSVARSPIAETGETVTVGPLTIRRKALDEAARLARKNSKPQDFFPKPPPEPVTISNSAHLARQLYGDRAAQVLRDQLATLSPGDYSPAAVRTWEKVLRALEREDAAKAKAKAKATPKKQSNVTD